MKSNFLYKISKGSKNGLLINIFVVLFFCTVLFLGVFDKNKSSIDNSKNHSFWRYLNNYLKNIVNPNDLTAYKDLKFIKKESKIFRDKRYGESQYRAIFFIFKVKFYDSKDIKFFVNSEFKTHEKVAEVALEFSKKIGQLPFFLRKKIKWVVIHGPWVDKEKCTCAWYAQRDAGFYIHTEMVHEPEHEETIIHEAAHVSIDSKFYTDQNFHVWKRASTSDKGFISKYASEHPRREDIAESVVAWVAARCKQNRIDKSIYNQIINTIPNRLKILDNIIDKNDTYPLVCKY
tara:strand:- start:1119 stop:1985 length:867 start_codon:yes stop_codon:yes gene_type:complete